MCIVQHCGAKKLKPFFLCKKILKPFLLLTLPPYLWINHETLFDRVY